MRFLIVGAGALGGYFGARMLDAGLDVTFLLRPLRAAVLNERGLAITSPHGNLAVPAPPHVLAEALNQAAAATYDVVIVTCRSYDLNAAMDAFAPAIGPATMVLPLLNGMRHLDALTQRFGAERVLGGFCIISAVVDAAGGITHLNDTHTLAFGELDGTPSTRTLALQQALSGVRFDARASTSIEHEMWEKWIFIAAVASATCLLRASVGDIVEGGGADIATGLYDEFAAIATSHGFAPRPAAAERARAVLTTVGSATAASMLRDIERGDQIEADQIVGDLLRRASSSNSRQPFLARIALAHLKTYQARRVRSA